MMYQTLLGVRESLLYAPILPQFIRWRTTAGDVTFLWETKNILHLIHWKNRYDVFRVNSIYRIGLFYRPSIFPKLIKVMASAPAWQCERQLLAYSPWALFIDKFSPMPGVLSRLYWNWIGLLSSGWGSLSSGCVRVCSLFLTGPNDKTLCPVL